MWAPVVLTFIYLSVGILLMLVLFWAAWRHRAATPDNRI